jgi:hypothetical protein
MVAATITYCTVDINWYADSGAIGHITSELDKLAIWDKYNAIETVHTSWKLVMLTIPLFTLLLTNLNYAIIGVFCIGKI